MKIRPVATANSVLVGFFVLGVIHSGCEQPDENCTKGYKPSNCVETTPADGIVRIKVAIDGTNPSVPITLFRGTIEQNQVVLVDTLKSDTKEYFLPNGEYAVRA